MVAQQRTRHERSLVEFDRIRLETNIADIVTFVENDNAIRIELCATRCAEKERWKSKSEPGGECRHFSTWQEQLIGRKLTWPWVVASPNLAADERGNLGINHVLIVENDHIGEIDEVAREKVRAPRLAAPERLEVVQVVDARQARVGAILVEALKVRTQFVGRFLLVAVLLPHPRGGERATHRVDLVLLLELRDSVVHAQIAPTAETDAEKLR